MIDGVYSCWDCRFSEFYSGEKSEEWDWKCIHPEAKELFTNDDPEENFRLCPYKEYRELEKPEVKENDQN